jgi:DNA-binding NarL/FixJ family response regulator
MDVTAVCVRSGDWWAVTVPEVDGGFTQARRLDQVPEMVADLVHLATGTPAEEVQVRVQPHLEDEAMLSLWEEAALTQEAARQRQEEAARQARRAVTELRAQGLSVRDVAALLHVSPQRVSQLAGAGH